MFPCLRAFYLIPTVALTQDFERCQDESLDFVKFIPTPFFLFTGFSVSTTMATIKSLARMKLRFLSSTHFCFRFLPIRLELSCDILGFCIYFNQAAH